MDRRMDAGLDTFALDIPPNFQRDLLAGRQPTIQLNIDATRMTQAFSGGGYIQTIVTARDRRVHPALPGQDDRADRARAALALQSRSQQDLVRFGDEPDQQRHHALDRS